MCDKTIISETFCVFLIIKTAGYHLKVDVFKLNQIYICQATSIEKTLMSALRQNEELEQIEIRANHRPLCKRIKHDKENILESAMWKRQ